MPDSDRYANVTAFRDDASACDYCSGAFGVDEAVQDAGVVQIDDNDGHPSIRSLVDGDYEIITFCPCPSGNGSAERGRLFPAGVELADSAIFRP